jgi:hypothetical protein
MPDIKVRVTKVADSPQTQSTNNLKVGFVKEGKFWKKPKKGKVFDVGLGFHTSVVVEIISEDTFRTVNSIYHWEMM